MDGAAATVAHDVTVVPLADLFPLGLGDVRAIKLDVQGFECKVLDGLWPLLLLSGGAKGFSSRLQLVATEIAEDHLAAQCCRPLWLLHALRSIGVPDALSLNRSVDAVQRGLCQRSDLLLAPRGAPSPGPECERYNINRLLGEQQQQQQHAVPRPWNVSCIGRSSVKEMTCVARRFNASAGAPAPYQLRNERHATPPTMANGELVREKMARCRAGQPVNMTEGA